MLYTLFVRYPEPSPSELTEAQIREGRSSFDNFAKELDNSGLLVSAMMFPSAAETTTVRLVGETLETVDGPADAEAAPIGGAFVIDVETEGDAFAIAHRAPSIAWGPVEVREVQTVFRDGEWRPA